MSQSQPIIESSSALRQDQLTILRVLTITGYCEGTSFLLLLGVAMPLKYMMAIPEGVRYIGMIHGILFIAYIFILISVTNKIKTPYWAMLVGVIGSLLPFGPFIFDRLLKKTLKNPVLNANVNV